MNHRRLINSLIPIRIMVPVLTHRFKGFKRTILTIIHPENYAADYNFTRNHMVPKKNDYTTQNLTIDIRATTSS